MKSLVSAVVQRTSLRTSHRVLVRLLGLAPAALLLSGLFTVWAWPLAAGGARRRRYPRQPLPGPATPSPLPDSPLPEHPLPESCPLPELSTFSDPVSSTAQ